NGADIFPCALTNCTLYFLTNALFFILSSMFNRLNTQYVSGISDSPMWNRGNLSRSNNRTLRPRWARMVETVLPAGPPPITTTSTLLSVLIRKAPNRGEEREISANCCRRLRGVSGRLEGERSGRGVGLGSGGRAVARGTRAAVLEA